MKKRKSKSEKKEYLSKEADIKSYQRCWRKNTQSKKINMNTDMRLFIISELESENIYISPKIIAAKWNKKDTVHISHTSIYAWLETGDGNKYKKHLAHSYKGYKTNKKERQSKIQQRIGIEERSYENEYRIETGHFEADLIVSKK